MKKILEEFKQFIMKGNVLDLAVAVIIGNAFSKIVNSLVNDIFMPVIGLILGGINFSSLSFGFGSARVYYGAFIQNVIDFLIVAACIFAVVKIVNTLSSKFKHEEKKIEEKKNTKSDEVVLLEEIRDLLKKKSK